MSRRTRKPPEAPLPAEPTNPPVESTTPPVEEVTPPVPETEPPAKYADSLKIETF